MFDKFSCLAFPIGADFAYEDKSTGLKYPPSITFKLESGSMAKALGYSVQQANNVVKAIMNSTEIKITIEPIE